MKEITPDRAREIQTAIDAFDRDWYFNTNTHEICLKRRSFFRKFCDFFWKKKYEVIAMYWWVNQNWSTENMMVHKFPMTHDNMPIKGFPIKAEMQGGWTIPKSDLKFLKNGPLTTEGRHEILVAANTGWESIIKIISRVLLLLGLIGTVIGITVDWENFAKIVSTLFKNLFKSY